MKTFKLIGLTISLLLAGSGVGLAQCPPNNFTMALPGMTSPNTFCYFKPFGVGRNSGNADLSFGDRGLLFCAYQSDDAKVRYRYPNYQPIGIEYHPWAQKLLFKITTGVQSPGTGNEITSWKTALSRLCCMNKFNLDNLIFAKLFSET